MIQLTLIAISTAILYLPSVIESSECTTKNLIHIGGVDLADVPQCELLLSPVRQQCVDQYMASVLEKTKGKICDLHSEWIKRALCCGVWEAKGCLVDKSLELPECGANISARYKELPSDRDIITEVYDICSEYGEGALICEDSFQSSAFSLNTLAIVLVIVLGLVFVLAFAWKLITKRKETGAKTYLEVIPMIFGKKPKNAYGNGTAGYTPVKTNLSNSKMTNNMEKGEMNHGSRSSIHKVGFDETDNDDRTGHCDNNDDKVGDNTEHVEMAQNVPFDDHPDNQDDHNVRSSDTDHNVRSSDTDHNVRSSDTDHNVRSSHDDHNVTSSYNDHNNNSSSHDNNNSSSHDNNNSSSHDNNNSSSHDNNNSSSHDNNNSSSHDNNNSSSHDNNNSSSYDNDTSY